MALDYKCRICGSEEDCHKYSLKEAMFGLSKGMGEEFEYFQCNSCQCLQIAEYPRDMNKYYPDDYVSLKKREGRRLGFFKRLFVEKKTKSYLLGGKCNVGVSKYLKWIGSGGCSLDARILDVGCGSGKLLLQYYKLGFKNLLGIDPFVNEDRQFENGIKILKKDIFEIDSSISGKFDFIIMSHTLEHMRNQEQVLKKAFELLSDDGCLFVRLPISDSYAWREYKEFWINADPPRHFYLHSIDSMKKLADKCSFEIKKTEFEAQSFALYGSEQNKQGIALKDEQSYWVNKSSNVFTEVEKESFENKTKELNDNRDGDFAIFYIFKKS